MRRLLERLWSLRVHAYLSLAVRLVVGAVFVYAAVPKILHPPDFAWSIAMYQMLHYSHVNLLALILPWVELLAGLALILGLRTRAAAVAVCGMLVMFVYALTHAITHEIEMTTCGCFSQKGARALQAHRDTVGTSLLYRDLAMFFATGYVWLFEPGRFTLERVLRSRLPRRRDQREREDEP